MHALLYWILFAVSLCPLWVLYRLSDLFFLLICHVLRYRKKVVYTNLKACFPNKEQKEIKKLAHAFYRHFCDLFVEVLKGYSLSDRALKKRVELITPDAISQISQSSEGTLVICSHYGNFEWMTSRLDLASTENGQIPTYGIYSPFRSAVFEHLMTRLRTRRGMELIPMRKAMIQSLRKLSQTCMLGLIADQSPSRQDSRYYVSFLGRPTAFHTSAAKLALRVKGGVFFADMRKKKRGYYSLELIPVSKKEFLPASREQIFAFTDLHASLLEDAVLDQPAYWLWSHKRWKHAPRESDYFSSRL